MMEFKGCLGRVEFDDDAGVFHGEVINTRDVVTFQGDSVASLKKAFHDSVEDYLAFCESRGELPGLRLPTQGMDAPKRNEIGDVWPVAPPTPIQR